MVIVGVADVIEGVGGVDGLVRYGRSHLFVQRRRPNAAPRFDRQKNHLRETVFLTCCFYLTLHFKIDDSG
jgi:hypothetical protein